MARSVRECALAWSVLTGRPLPAPRLAGLTVGLLTRMPRLGPDEEEWPLDERATVVVAELEGLGARAVEVELPVPPFDTWPVFTSEALATHRETFPARADDYGLPLRKKLEAATRTTPAEVAESRRALAAWRDAAAREPAIDLFLSPTLGLPVPPADAPELEVRIAMSGFTRPFSYLGWSAVALGEIQLAARDDETVIAAALAWEEAGARPVTFA
jgi:Asp-tRNA(Asn)/Glu-tRNA(Gln) amidotransferase A subunit family amidase